MDKFYELMVTPNNDKKYNIVNSLFIISLILDIVLFIIYPIIMFFVAIIITIPSFFIKRKAFVEYEYEFTEGDLDVSAIYEKKRRKYLIGIDIRKIECMAPKDHELCKRYKVFKEASYYCGILDNKKVYSIIVKEDGKFNKYNVFLDKKMVDLCYFKNPQKVISFN